MARKSRRVVVTIELETMASLRDLKDRPNWIFDNKKKDFYDFVQIQANVIKQPKAVKHGSRK